MKSFLFAALAFLTVSAPGLAHNVHATATEIEWNATDNSIEVIVQIHAHQLEARLSYDAGRRLTILSDSDLPAIEQMAGKLVAANLKIDADGDPVPLGFLGMEVADQMVRLYLEADWPQAPEALTVMNAVFIDELPGQINAVVAKVGRHRKGGRITSRAVPLRLTFP